MPYTYAIEFVMAVKIHFVISYKKRVFKSAALQFITRNENTNICFILFQNCRSRVNINRLNVLQTVLNLNVAKETYIPYIVLNVIEDDCNKIKKIKGYTAVVA